MYISLHHNWNYFITIEVNMNILLSILCVIGGVVTIAVICYTLCGILYRFMCCLLKDELASLRHTSPRLNDHSLIIDNLRNRVFELEFQVCALENVAKSRRVSKK